MRRTLNFKLLGIVLGSLLVVAVGVHFLHAYQMQQNAYRLLERGDHAIRAKDVDQALTLYEQYLTFVPNDVDTVEKYARALDQVASTDATRVRLILLMEQVLRVKPNEHDFRFRLVHNLLALDRVTEAIDHLRKLENHWHDKAEVLHILGWCQEVKKDYRAAVSSFEAAIKQKPTQIVSYGLLIEVLQDRLNQPEEAQKVMETMVRANPQSYQAYLLRARFHRRQGEEKAAESDLQMALKVAPDQPEVILAVADAARARGDWAEATRLLQNGLKKHPEQADFYKLMVAVKIHADRRTDAIDVLRAGVRQAPKSNELAVLLIDLLIDQKQYSEARTKIDDLTKAGMKPTLPKYLTARLRIADADWNEAIKLLEEVRQELGDGSEWNGRVNVLLGICYRQIGDAEQEMQAFRRAVQEEPTWLATSVGLGSALLEAGRIEEASQILEALRTAPELPAGYWILLSRCRLARQMRVPASERRWESVDEAIAQAAQSDPKALEVPFVRADLLAARGDFVGAKAVLEKLGAGHPGEVSVWCALADLSARQNRIDEAEAILERAGADPTFADRIELRLARCQLWARRGSDADRAKLAKLNENLPTAWTAAQRARLTRALAEAWQRLGDAARAETSWRELARAMPNDVRSRSNLFDIALEKHQIARARVWLDELRTVEGPQGWLWRYGAIALQIHEANGNRAELAEARTKLQELDKAHKNWPRLSLLSASIYEREGQIPQAIQEYLRALELGETQPRVMARLLGLLIERREFGKAETELGKYEQKVPLTPELLRLGAEVAVGLREKRYAKLAVTRAEQALTFPLRDYRDGLWLARLYDAAGDSDKADALLLQCLDQAGYAPDPWIAWMKHLALTNQRARAAKELDRMKKELSKSRLPLALARCYEALWQLEPAAEAYQQALLARPDDFIVVAHAADFYRRADEPGRAVKLYARLLDPAHAAPADLTASARRHLAVLLAPLGAPERSQALELLDLNRAMRGDNLADERVRWLIRSLTKAHREDAIHRFQDSLRAQPPSADERLLLAQMLESADQFSQARGQLAEAVDESPRSPQILVRYAHVLIRTGELEEADYMCKAAEGLEPGSRRVRDLRIALDRAKKQAAQ